MSFLHQWRHRARAMFRSETVRAEREAEIEFHLSLETMQTEHDGLRGPAAREAARRQFGNVTAHKEAARGVSRTRWFDAALQDVRYALRILRRSPGYALGASAILALGVGPTTGVFSIFDTVVLRAVPYADPNRLYVMLERRDDGAQRTPSYPAYRDWLADSNTWRGRVDDMAFVRGRGTWLDGADGAERVLVANVSHGFFQVMNTRPYMGRTLLPSDESPASERVAVLSFDTWRRYYGGDNKIVGKSVTIDSAPTTIIGVMPPRFTFPQWGTGRDAATRMWMPLASIEKTDLPLSKRGDHADSRVVLRVATTADSTRATAALAVVASRLAAAFPAESRTWTHVDLEHAGDGGLGNSARLLRLLAAAAGFVLLLSCLNFANLSFVRGTARARELAVRAALGAGRPRIIRQLVTESLVVSMAGCGGGLLLASTIIGVTRTLAINQMTGADSLAVNGTMLAFAVAVSVLVAVASAIVPAFRATRVAPVSTIRSGAQAAIGGRSDAQIRSVLVVLQLAVALVLLVGTDLLVQSFRNANAVPLGYEPAGLITTRISPSRQYDKADDALALYQHLIERVAAIPGVSDVGFVSQTGLSTAVAVGASPPPSEALGPTAPLYRTTSEGYLRAMGMRMTAGHWFTHDDMRERERFVLNEPFARQLFPNTPAVGQRITVLRAARARPDFGQPVTGTVIGIVAVGGNGPGGPPSPEIYVPFTLETWTWGGLAIRTRNAATAVPLVRDAMRSVDPSIPEARASATFNGVAAASDELDGSLARQRMMLSAIVAFALSALLLAAVGMYSVLAYGVSRRTREVGVRVALGATNGSILRLILGEGARLALAGAMIGSATAAVATRLIRSMLFGTTPTDVPTYVAAVGVLLVTAAVACYIPARRAARLSPSEAIRSG